MEEFIVSVISEWNFEAMGNDLLVDHLSKIDPDKPIKPPLPDKPTSEELCRLPRYSLCDNKKMDFGCASYTWKQFVFWFTIPMIAFNTGWILFLLKRTLTNFQKIRKSTLMSKLQLILIFVIAIIEIAQLSLYNIS